MDKEIDKTERITISGHMSCYLGVLSNKIHNKRVRKWNISTERFCDSQTMLLLCETDSLRQGSSILKRKSAGRTHFSFTFLEVYLIFIENYTGISNTL